MTEKKNDRALPILEINDFGPIKSAKIELRPLTVFVGEGNTGKSYLTALIYALHCAIANRYEMIYPALRFRYQSGPKANDKTNQYIDRLLENALSKNSKKVLELGYEHANNIVQSILGDDDSLLFEIKRSFGIKSDSNIRRKFSRRKRALVRLIQPGSSYDCRSNIVVSEIGHGCEIEIVGPSDVQLNLETIEQQIDQAADQRGSFSIESEQVRNLGTGLKRVVFSYVMPTQAKRAYYLPADRTGVMHSHRAVVNALLSSALTAGLLPGTGVPPLSGVLSDFLRGLVAMDEMVGTRTESEKRRERAQHCGKLLIGWNLRY